MNIQEYSIALTTSFERNKNSAAVAREAETSQSSTSRFLKKANLDDHDFLSQVRAVFGNKKTNLVIDEVVLSKRYAKEIEGTSSMIDQSTKTFTNGCKMGGCRINRWKTFFTNCYRAMDCGIHS